MKKMYLTFLILSFLMKSTTSVLAMDDDDLGEYNDSYSKNVNYDTIQDLPESLKNLGVKLKEEDKIIIIPLEGQKQLLALGTQLAKNSKLFEYHDVHLDSFFCPSSFDMKTFQEYLERLVSIKLYGQTLYGGVISNGEILNTLIGNHRNTLKILDFDGDQKFKFTDDGLVAIKGGISSLHNITKLVIRNQELLSGKGLATLLESLKTLTTLEELTLASMNLGSQEKDLLSALSQLTCLTKLDLSNNELSGSCLEAIAVSLPKLEELNISNNKITGQKLLSFPRYHPRECLKVLNIAENKIDDIGFYCISLLPNLTELDISYKNTTFESLKVNWGAKELAKNSTLTKLNLLHNKNIDIEGAYALAQNPKIELVGTNLGPSQKISNKVLHPWQILILTHTPILTELTLSGCTIGDKEAQVLALSKSLTKLDLSHTKVKDQGAQYLALSPNLKRLNLSNNQITDEGAKVLAKSTSLTELDLSYNKIEGKGAEELANSKTLTRLNLCGNEDIDIKGVYTLAKNFGIELELGTNVDPKYTFLDLRSRRLNPWNMLVLTRTPFTELNLSGCKIGDENIGDKEVQVLALSKSLTTLNLSHNKVKTEGIEALRQCNTLTWLDLSHNQLTNIGAQYLALNPNLKWLNLSNNQITDEGAKVLAKSTSLTELDLSYNKIEGKGAEELANSKTLTRLNLCGNEDIDIKGVYTLAKNFGIELELGTNVDPKYTLLDLRNRKLNPWNMLVLTRTTTFTGLNLSDCKIGDENIGDKEVQVLALSKSLTTLNLSHNKVKDEGIEALHQCNTLTWLDLSHNQLTNIGAQYLALSPNLKWLNLSNNQITDEGAEVLGQCGILTWLDLSHTKVKDQGAQYLALSPNLKWLNLSNNQITAEGAHYLATSPSLKELDLSNNKIKNFFLSSTVSLEKLNLTGCEIGKGLTFSEKNTNLKWLNLSNNQITDNEAKYLVEHPSLKYLHLSGNQITSKGAEHLAKTTTLTNLDLSDNKVGDWGAQALSTNSTLTCLNLSRNGIGCNGVIAWTTHNPFRKISILLFDIEKVFDSNTTLTKLGLSGNRISDEGAQYLARSTAFRELDLSYNQITDRGAEALANNTTLIKLDLSHNLTTRQF